MLPSPARHLCIQMTNLTVIHPSLGTPPVPVPVPGLPIPQIVPSLRIERALLRPRLPNSSMPARSNSGRNRPDHISTPRNRPPCPRATARALVTPNLRRRRRWRLQLLLQSRRAILRPRVVLPALLCPSSLIRVILGSSLT